MADPDLPDPMSMPSLLGPSDNATALLFSYGVLDVVRTLLAAMVGRDMVWPEILARDLQQRADLSDKTPQRAAPALMMIKALEDMARARQAAHAKIIPAENVSQSRN